MGPSCTCAAAEKAKRNRGPWAKTEAAGRQAGAPMCRRRRRDGRASSRRWRARGSACSASSPRPGNRKRRSPPPSGPTMSGCGTNWSAPQGRMILDVIEEKRALAADGDARAQQNLEFWMGKLDSAVDDPHARSWPAWRRAGKDRGQTAQVHGVERIGYGMFAWGVTASTGESHVPE